MPPITLSYFFKAPFFLFFRKKSLNFSSFGKIHFFHSSLLNSGWKEIYEVALNEKNARRKERGNARRKERGNAR